MARESKKAKTLAENYKKYFEKRFCTDKELAEAEKTRQEYIKETNYKIND